MIVRKDLPLGHIAAQVAHAAGSGSNRHPPGTYVVVLAARSAQHLDEVSRVLESRSIEHTRVEESDGPYAGQLMALGLELVNDRTMVRKAVSQLPLLR